MVEYHTVNAKLSDSQLNKLKSAVKNKKGTTLRTNDKMFNGNNLPRELLLTTRQTIKLKNAIESNMSTDTNLSQAQISKIIQSGGFLGKLLSPLLKIGLPLTKNVIKLLAKSVLISLGLTAAASAADARIQKKKIKKLGSGTTTLIISNEEMNDIIKIVQVVEDSNILLKGVTKTIKNETKEKRRLFIKAFRHFRRIFIRKFINRKRNYKSRRRNCKSLVMALQLQKSFNSTTSSNKF